MLYLLSLPIKEEYEVLQSDRQEKVHKLNELAPRCEEVERQHAEEAEKCRFWKVPPLYVNAVGI